MGNGNKYVFRPHRGGREWSYADVKKPQTLDEFLRAYEKSYVNAGGAQLKDSRSRSWKKDLSSLHRLFSFFSGAGVNTISAIRRSHVLAWKDSELADGKLKPASINKAIRVGHAALAYAINREMVDPDSANPFSGVQPAKTAKYDPRNLSEDEVRAVLYALSAGMASGTLPRWLEPTIALALYAGLRMAEVRSLEWDDVLLEAGVIRIRCDETFATKSRRPREVPIAPELRDVLLACGRDCGYVGAVIVSERTSRAVPERTMSDYVERLSRLSGCRPWSLHDLRRSFSGFLASRGVAITRIKDYLGHASTNTTETYYVGRVERAASQDVAGLSFTGTARHGGAGRGLARHG